MTTDPPHLPDPRSHVATFVHRAIAAESVWSLEGDRGLASCSSLERPSRDVLVFWTDRQDAHAAVRTSLPGHQPVSIPLYDFLFLWLPDMADGSVRAGPDWDASLAGPEVEARQLQNEVVDAMPEAMLQRYVERLRNALAEQDEAGPDEGEPTT